MDIPKPQIVKSATVAVAVDDAKDPNDEKIQFILKQVHLDIPSISDDAVELIKSYLAPFSLAMRDSLNGSNPSITGLMKIIDEYLPGELAKHAKNEGLKAIDNPGKLVFEFEFTDKPNTKAFNYFANGALEYLFAELLELSGNITKENPNLSVPVSVNDVKQAVAKDSELQGLIDYSLKKSKPTTVKKSTRKSSTGRRAGAVVRRSSTGRRVGAPRTTVRRSSGAPRTTVRRSSGCPRTTVRRSSNRVSTGRRVRAVDRRSSNKCPGATRRSSNRVSTRKSSTGRKRSATRKSSTGRKRSATRRSSTRKSSKGRKRSATRKSSTGRKRSATRKSSTRKSSTRKSSTGRKRAATRCAATNMTVPELKALCKKKGVTGYSTMRKAELLKKC